MQTAAKMMTGGAPATSNNSQSKQQQNITLSLSSHHANCWKTMKQAIAQGLGRFGIRHHKHCTPSAVSPALICDVCHHTPPCVIVGVLHQPLRNVPSKQHYVWSFALPTKHAQPGIQQHKTRLSQGFPSQSPFKRWPFKWLSERAHLRQKTTQSLQCSAVLWLHRTPVATAASVIAPRGQHQPVMTPKQQNRRTQACTAAYNVFREKGHRGAHCPPLLHSTVRWEAPG